MNRYWSKPHSGRHKEATEPNHWLGAGRAGQENLLLELDPKLYVLDQSLAALASAIYHSVALIEDKPYALFFSPGEAVGWQLGYLSKFFNVYVYTESADEVSTEAADRFEAKLLRGDFREELEHSIDLCISTSYAWSEPLHLGKMLKSVRQVLSPGGKCCFAFAAEGENENLEIIWGNGNRSCISNSTWREEICVPVPDNVELFCLSDFEPEVLLPAFSKRNRDFFGKDMRDSFLQRMAEADFKAEFSPQAKPKQWAGLALWS